MMPVRTDETLTIKQHVLAPIISQFIALPSHSIQTYIDLEYVNVLVNKNLYTMRYTVKKELLEHVLLLMFCQCKRRDTFKLIVSRYCLLAFEAALWHSEQMNNH